LIEGGERERREEKKRGRRRKGGSKMSVVVWLGIVGLNGFLPFITNFLEETSI
jgi:hypothetical protein